MIIPDVNLLLYAHSEADMRFDLANQWWRDLLSGTEEVGLPWSVVTGFMRISTSRRSPISTLTPAQAVATVNEWYTYEHVQAVNPGPQHMILMGRLLEAVGIGGNRIPDVHIAAIAMEVGAEVHSHDNDFARFPGLRWRNPLSETG